jgi:hypothetical protein
MSANLDSQLQRWQVAGILREKLPGADASTIASLVWEVFRDGREAYSSAELAARCFEIIKQREKEAK